MSIVEEVDLPSRLNISEAREIVGKLRNVDVLHLKNDFVDIKIVKFTSPVELYLVFGEKYVVDDDCKGSWVDILHVFDGLEDLAWFLNGL